MMTYIWQLQSVHMRCNDSQCLSMNIIDLCHQTATAKLADNAWSLKKSKNCRVLGKEDRHSSPFQKPSSTWLVQWWYQMVKCINVAISIPCLNVTGRKTKITTANTVHVMTSSSKHVCRNLHKRQDLNFQASSAQTSLRSEKQWQTHTTHSVRWSMCPPLKHKAPPTHSTLQTKYSTQPLKVNGNYVMSKNKPMFSSTTADRHWKHRGRTCNNWKKAVEKVWNHQT